MELEGCLAEKGKDMVIGRRPQTWKVAEYLKIGFGARPAWVRPGALINHSVWRSHGHASVSQQLFREKPHISKPKNQCHQICEVANPSNCDSAVVTVSVARPVVNAVNDQAKASSKRPNIAIANVLANDRLGNVRATTSNVRLSLVSLSPPSSGIKLDLADGSVDVIKKVESGKYTLVYQICELADPSNCDQATVTLELSGGL